jgi:hypothetical protein
MVSLGAPRSPPGSRLVRVDTGFSYDELLAALEEALARVDEHS